MTKKLVAPTKVDAVRHKMAMPKNIPIEELRDFVTAEENPSKAALHSHDSS